MYKKVLYSIAGASTASLIAWRTLFPWIGDDLKLIKTGLVTSKRMEEILEKGKPFIDFFEEQVAKDGKKPFIIFDDDVYTYEFINEQANRVANIVKTWGIGVGETVAILIYNEPAFLWTSFGLQKLGIVTANLNFNLKSQQLAHCVKASEAKALIVGAGEALLDAVDSVREEMGGIPVYVQGVGSVCLPSDYIDFDELMSKSLPVSIDKTVRSAVTMHSTACLIYTSGTTGLPKPAIVTQIKLYGFSLILHLVNVCPDDVIYLTLPLYHTAGEIALYGGISVGCTVVLKRRFSASQFWDDCRKYNVTIIQYIGELLRYLVAQPKNPLDAKHCVRAAIGNGLRKDIFSEFQNRFKVPLICELYGATEGIGMTFSISNIPGAIGRMSPFLKWLVPNKYYKTLIKYDYEKDEPIRDKNGRCVEIGPGENGLFITIISQYVFPSDAKFYMASSEANEKKIIRNAFKTGDAFFNSGDLFYLDKNYVLYFADRIGDTFRWKGENVSTTEVANVLTKASFIHDANVYGVQIPGHDGRAGMAAITLCEDEVVSEDKLETLAGICDENLPSYARPLFLRIQKETALTATFKQQKFHLVKEGFDPSKVKDPLYYLDPNLQQYVPVTPDLYSYLVTRSKL